MQPLVVFMVLLSALMHATRSFLNKKALDKQVFIWWYEVFGLLFFTPVFLYALYREGANPAIAIVPIILSGLIHFVYWIFLSTALEKGDLSLVYPIMRSSPAPVLLFSITILGEDVSPGGLAGIMLVAFGVYIINMKRLGTSELTRPIRAVGRDRAVQFALLTLLSVACYSVVDKIGATRMNPVMFAYMYPWISFVLYSAYIFSTKPKGTVKAEWAGRKKPIVACGFLSIFGYFLIIWAFTIERMSYVVGLRQVSIVFAVLMGGHLLKEKNKSIRLGASIIIFVGAYLIVIAK